MELKLKLAIFIIIFAGAQASVIKIGSVTASNYLIRSTADLSFAVQITTGIDANGKILVVFPDQFKGLNKTLCSISGVSNSSGVVCSVSNSTISISGCFPSTSYTLEWYLYSIPTPLYAGTTDSFKIYTLSLSSAVLDYISAGLSLSFLPQKMISGSLKSQNSTAGLMSDWVLRIKTEFEVPGIYLTLPDWNGYMLPVYEYSYCINISCTSIYSKAYIDFYLNTSCLCTDTLLNIPGTSNGGEIWIGIQMIAPPSTDNVTGFSVYTAGSLGTIEYIDIYVQPDNPGALDIVFDPDSYEIEATNNYLVSVTCQNPVPANGTIVYTFSNGIDIEKSSVIGIYGIDFYCDYQITFNSILIKGSFVSYLIQNTVIIIQIINSINPQYAAAETLKVEIFTHTGGTICAGNKNLTFIPYYLPASIYPDSLKINEITSYEFYITSGYVVSSLAIYFPYQIGFSLSNCSYSVICNFYYPLVEVIVLNNTNPIVFNISGIVNPSNTSNTDFFLIQQFNSSDFKNLLAENTNNYVKCSPGDIKASISIGNQIAGIVTNYTIKVQLENKLPSNGILIIQFPEEVSVSISSACTYFQGFSSTAVCRILYNSITVNQGFTESFSPLVQVTISSVKNPTSICPTSSFKISSLSNGSVVDTVSTGIAIAISSPNLAILTIRSYSYIVGDLTSYIFSLETSNYITSTIQVTIPSTVSISNPICDGISAQILSITCKVLLNKLNIQIELSSNNSNYLEFKVDGVLNPTSLIASNIFYIKTLQNGCIVDEGSYNLTMDTPGVLDVSLNANDTDIASPAFYHFTIKYSNTVPPNGTLLISFPAEIVINDKVYCYPLCQKSGNVLVLPPVSNLTVYGLTNPISSIGLFLFKVWTSSPSYIIDSFQGYLIKITCSGSCMSCAIKSDYCHSCYGSYILYNFTCIQNCPVAYTYINNTCIQCDSNCKSCLGTQSNCSECYTGVVYEGTCISECPYNVTVQVGNYCMKCHGNCASCQYSVFNCTLCTNSSLYMNTCVDVCPDGYTSILGVCSACGCSQSLLNNGVCDSECNTIACNYDNNDCINTLSLKSLPSVTSGLGTVTVSSVNKFMGGGNFLGSSMAGMGLGVSCSWIAMASTLNTNQKRRLQDTGASSIISDLLIVFLVMKFVLNLGFTIVYFYKYAPKDNIHYEWMSKRKTWTIIIGLISGTLSFHLIRLTYSGPNCMSCCKAQFFRMSTINILLIAYSVLTLIFVIAPVISLLVYALFIYNDQNNVFMQAADCLGLTIMIAIFNIVDLVILSLEVGKESAPKTQATVTPLATNETKFAEETFNAGFDEALSSKRNLKDTDNDPQELYPSTQFYEFNIGEKFEIDKTISSENILRDEINENLFIYFHEFSNTQILLKETLESREDNTIKYKILDVKYPEKDWIIGRTVNEFDIKVLGVDESDNSCVIAYHMRSGYDIIVSQSYAGSFLKDLETGTVLSGTLSNEDSIKVIPDQDDLHYGTIKLNNSYYRVNRLFQGAKLIDVLPKTKQNLDVTFNASSDILEPNPITIQSQLDPKSEIDTRRLRRKKLDPIQRNPFIIEEKKDLKFRSSDPEYT